MLAISAIIAVLSLLWDNVDMLRGPIEAVFGEKGLAVFDNFKNGLDGVFGFIDGLFHGGLADALSGVRGMFEGALEGGGLLSTIFGGTEEGLAAFDAVVSVLQSVLGFIGQVVDFANGTMKPVIMEIFSYITGTVMPTLIGVFTAAAPTISSIISSVGTIIMTVVEGVMGVLQALWPSIQQIIDVVMEIAAAVIPALLNAIDLVLPVVQGIIELVIPIVTVAISTVGGLISGLASSIGEIVAGIVEVFNGLISFIQGVFTGNWTQAWEGIKSIFGGAFDALVGLCKMPINAVISIINGAIRGLNSISCDIPDWVPVVGGQHFGINIAEIPLLARGGFTNGPSIAGEAGTEAVISFQPSVRTENIATWARAGEMLGTLPPARDAGGQIVSVVGIPLLPMLARGGFTSGPSIAGEAGTEAVISFQPGTRTENIGTWARAGELLGVLNPLEDAGGAVRLQEVSAGAGAGSGFNITYAPNINIHGNADRQTVDAALMDSEKRFESWVEQNFERLYSRMERQRSRTGYA